MAIPPYARTLCSVDGDTAVVGVRTVVGGNVIQLSGENTSFWTSQRWELYDVPVGYTVPAGWSTDAAGTFFATTTAPPPFTVSQPRDRFGKYAIRLTVNGGIKAGVTDSEMTDETVAVLVKSHAGLETCFEQEDNQFGTSWAESLKRDSLTLEKAVGHSLTSITTVDATVTTIKQFPAPTNSRLYMLQCKVLAFGAASAQSALYDVRACYVRDGAGVYTGLLNTIVTLWETTAGFQVLEGIIGSNLELYVVGAAATSLRWHVMEERFWSVPL